MVKKRILNSAITVVVCLVQSNSQMLRSQQTVISHRRQERKSVISEKFVGTWKLVSTEGRPSGTKHERNPTGYIVYDSTGHMHVQIMLRNDREKFASEDLVKATVEEKALAYDGYVAYYGTYTINEAEGIITHHLEGSLDPNDIGKDLIRYFEFSGARITLIPTNLVRGKLKPKSEVERRLTWERVK